MFTKMRWMLRLSLALVAAVVLAAAADLAADTLDPCPECYQCTCMQLCCDGTSVCGSNAQCEQWDTDDDTCQRSGGCTWSCPGGSSGTYCCKDYCPPGFGQEPHDSTFGG